jgi:hypothetical protein
MTTTRPETTDEKPEARTMPAMRRIVELHLFASIRLSQANRSPTCQEVLR